MKECFLKKVFSRKKLLPSPVMYTQKEVKLKMNEILRAIEYRKQYKI